VVVGGDAAGMSAASQARRRRSPADLEITAYERSSWVSYSACGEPYHIAGHVDPLEALVARTPEQFAEMDIGVHIRHEVTAIDTASRTVTVRSLDDGAVFDETYDQLLIATGATAVRPPITGRDLAGVHELRTLDDAAASSDRRRRSRLGRRGRWGLHRLGDCRGIPRARMGPSPSSRPIRASGARLDPDWEWRLRMPCAGEASGS
jgi:NADPH-dependent 2,4-dienoyl-CoA reductase/sulfur reductase-like enzyme